MSRGTLPTIGDVSTIGSVFRAVWVLVLAIIGEHCTGLAILLIALNINIDHFRYRCIGVAEV